MFFIFGLKIIWINTWLFLQIYLVKIRKFHFLTLDSFFVPLLSALAMLVVVSGFVAVLQISPIAKLLLSFFLGFLIYLGLTFPMAMRFKKDFLGKKKARGKDERSRSVEKDIKQDKLVAK